MPTRTARVYIFPENTLWIIDESFTNLLNNLQVRLPVQVTAPARLKRFRGVPSDISTAYLLLSCSRCSVSSEDIKIVKFAVPAAHYNGRLPDQPLSPNKQSLCRLNLDI